MKKHSVETVIYIILFSLVFIGYLLGRFFNYRERLDLIGEVSKYKTKEEIWHERYLYCESLLKGYSKSNKKEVNDEETTQN